MLLPSNRVVWKVKEGGGPPLEAVNRRMMTVTENTDLFGGGGEFEVDRNKRELFAVTKIPVVPVITFSTCF
jgi:hypothetical protein